MAPNKTKSQRVEISRALTLLILGLPGLLTAQTAQAQSISTTTVSVSINDPPTTAGAPRPTLPPATAFPTRRETPPPRESDSESLDDRESSDEDPLESASSLWNVYQNKPSSTTYVSVTLPTAPGTPGSAGAPRPTLPPIPGFIPFMTEPPSPNNLPPTNNFTPYPTQPPITIPGAGAPRPTLPPINGLFTRPPTSASPTFNPPTTALPSTTYPTPDPTNAPTLFPTTFKPNLKPTLRPTSSPKTASPTNHPTTASPTPKPTPATWPPTLVPSTAAPTPKPTPATPKPTLSKPTNSNAQRNSIVCPRAGRNYAGRQVDNFDPVRRFNEISGLALSRTQVSPSTGHPIMYVVNDGHEEDTADAVGRMGVFDSGTGERLATLLITQPNSNSQMESWDWEALTIGPCSPLEPRSSCLYIADVGDNVARNTEGRRSDRTDAHPYRIHKIREPRIQDLPLDSGRNQNSATAEILDTLEFDYFHPQSPKDYADSEAIFMDPVGWGGQVGDIYVITKWNYANVSLSRLYQIPQSAWNRRVVVSPAPVGTFDPSYHDLLRTKWTGADHSSDGTVIALSDYYATYLFLRCPGATVAEALLGNSCHQFAHASPGQVETSALYLDGRLHLEIPEGIRPAIGWTELVYDNYVNEMADLFDGFTYSSNQVCPQLEWFVSGSTTTCRTSAGKQTRPNLWCYHSTNQVHTVAEGEVQEDPFDVPAVDVGRKQALQDAKPTKTSASSNDKKDKANTPGLELEPNREDESIPSSSASITRTTILQSSVWLLALSCFAFRG